MLRSSLLLRRRATTTKQLTEWFAKHQTAYFWHAWRSPDTGLKKTDNQQSRLFGRHVHNKYNCLTNWHLRASLETGGYLNRWTVITLVVFYVFFSQAWAVPERPIIRWAAHNRGKIRLHLVTEAINQQVSLSFHNCGWRGLQLDHDLSVCIWIFEKYEWDTFKKN